MPDGDTQDSPQWNTEDMQRRYGIAPEILAPTAQMPLTRDVSPGTGVAPPELKMPNQPTNWGRLIGQIMMGVGAGIDRNPQSRASTMQALQNSQAQQAAEHRATQTDALRTFLASVAATGNHEAYSDAIKKIGGLKLDPGVLEPLKGDLMKMGTEAGQARQNQQAADQFMQSLPPEVAQGPAGKLLSQALSSNLLPATKDLLMKSALDQIMPKPKTPSQQLDERKLNVLNLMQNRDQLTPDIQHKLDSEASALGMNPIPAGERISPTLRDRYAEAGIPLTDINSMSQLESSGYPAMLRAYNTQQKFDTFKQQEMIRTQDRKDMMDYTKSMSPPPKNVLYVNKKSGEVDTPVSMLDAEQRAKSGELVPLTGKQADIRTAADNMFAHVDLSLRHLEAMGQSTGGKVGQFLDAKFKTLKNDPNAVVLFDQIGKMTALATGPALSAGLPGARGSKAMADYVEKIGITLEDSPRTALGKLSTLLTLAERRQKDAGIPQNSGVLEDLKSKINHISQGGTINPRTGLKQQFMQ